MNQFVDAAERAILDENWYAALMISLALPDIAGWVESGSRDSKRRYVDWVDRFVSPNYTSPIGPERTSHTFLSGRDCYALRCKLLHQGMDDISDAPARDVLNRFVFMAPQPGLMVHRNQIGDMLQLQVDSFCRDICQSIKDWLAELPATDVQRADRLRELAVIQASGPIGPILVCHGHAATGARRVVVSPHG